MTLSIIKYPLALIITSLVSTSSIATTITIYDDLSDNTYVSGSAVSGVFDLNSSLNTNNNYIQPYDINSAFVRMRFNDDHDYGQRQFQDIKEENVKTTGLLSSPTLGTYKNQYDYIYNLTNRTERDIALIKDIDNQTSRTSESTASLENKELYHFPQYSGSFTEGYCYTYRGFDINCKTYIYNVGYNATYDYGSTDWGINYYLGEDALNTLIADGIYEFDLLGLNGTDFNLSYASLSVNINENPGSSSSSNDIPEPSIIALFGAGILGFGFARRRNPRQE